MKSKKERPARMDQDILLLTVDLSGGQAMENCGAAAYMLKKEILKMS